MWIVSFFPSLQPFWGENGASINQCAQVNRWQQIHITKEGATPAQPEHSASGLFGCSHPFWAFENLSSVETMSGSQSLN
jgi:hypothetical protein